MDAYYGIPTSPPYVVIFCSAEPRNLLSVHGKYEVDSFYYSTTTMNESNIEMSSSMTPSFLWIIAVSCCLAVSSSRTFPRFPIHCQKLITNLQVLGKCIYRVTFHPLAGYPGPSIARLTTWYGAYHALKGDLHLDMWECHRRYGMALVSDCGRKSPSTHGI